MYCETDTVTTIFAAIGAVGVMVTGGLALSWSAWTGYQIVSDLSKTARLNREKAETEARR